MKKSIMTIPIYYHSEKKYDEDWEDKFQKTFKIPNSQYSDDMILQFRMSYHEPRCHRFNDILGYAELVLDVHDILIYYHLNGDQRKVYNRNNPFRIYKKGIYFSNAYSWGGKFREVSNKSIRNAIEHSFKEIESQCNSWKVYIQLDTFREKINYFDFEGYFRYKNWFNYP